MPNGKFRVNADLDQEHFDYFFRHVFVGERGPRQALICTFFLKLKQACVEAGIQPVWDETNEQRVATILNHLNFVDVAITLRDYTEHYHRGFAAGVASVEAQSEPQRPPRTRRTPRPPTIPKAQPISPANDHGPTGGTGEATPNGSNVSSQSVEQT